MLDQHLVVRDLPELLRLFAQDRRQGLLLHRFDYAIATGIRDHRDQLLAAVNVSGPDTEMNAAARGNGLAALLAKLRRASTLLLSVQARPMPRSGIP